LKIINICLISILSLAILSSSCDDYSHSHSEHFAPEGWLFIDGSGSRFIQIFRGKFISGSSTEFLVPLDGNTDHLKIKFLDKNEKEVEPPKSSEYTLRWEISDNSIVDVERHGNHEWEFHLKGLTEGTTTIQFHVMHGGHSDVRSGFINVRVQKVD
jgi:hypothetical protein